MSKLTDLLEQIELDERDNVFAGFEMPFSTAKTLLKIAEAAFTVADWFEPREHYKYDVLGFPGVAGWKCGRCSAFGTSKEEIIHISSCYYQRIRDLEAELESGD